ncbi:glycosyltransferase family 4 protein [Candidatus Peregrinibacteria bacterium]|nr:glycosyltransferase family 4 protein [Candidatus Peregrinibacteria bacterium]
MKICFILPGAYPLFNKKNKFPFGGAEVQLSLLAKILAKKKDLDVHFVVYDHGQNKVEKYDLVNVWKAYRVNTGFIKKNLILFSVIKKIDADAYITRGIGILSSLSFFITLYCRLKKKKFIFMLAHDDEAENLNRLGTEIFIRVAKACLFKKADIRYQISKLIFKITSKYFQLVVCQNINQYHNLKTYLPKNKLVIVKKGIDFQSIQHSTIKKKWDAIWVGRCEVWKKGEIFLEMAKGNPSLNFAMVCTSNAGNSSFEKIKNEAEQISNLDFCDFVSNEEVYEYLRNSKVFCITSLKEGDWPMTVLEAMAHKLPIISYTLDYGNILKDKKCGFCCYNKEELLGEYLRELIKDNKLYEEMSENAYNYVRETHDIKKNSLELLKAIS